MPLGDLLPGLQFDDSNYDVSPNEVDRYEIYHVLKPTVSQTWFGTTTVGTSQAARALVLISALADYPRNVAGIVTGSNDVGGVWTVNGKDQFGNTIAETITIGTTANGGTVAGTKIFAQVTSGTFTLDADSVGNGTPKLGADTIGTSCYFGLPVKIGSTADVVNLVWNDGGTLKPINGGTIGAYVSTTTHSFRGTAALDAADDLYVWVNPSYNNSGGSRVSKLTQV